MSALGPGPNVADDAPVGDLRRTVLRFLGFSALVLVVLVVATVLIDRLVIREAALRQARKEAQGLYTKVVAPLVNEQLRQGRPAARERLATVLDSRVNDGSLRHIKLWASDGTVLWADERALIGRRYPLEPDVQELFGTTTVTADVTDLSKAENVAERARGEGEAVEVYAGAFDANGAPVVFEAYMPTDPLKEDEAAILGGTLPVAIGGLVLMLLLMLPLTGYLTSRVRQSEAARTRWAQHALRASELERRRIATELHDGVVQDLAGVGFALPSLGREFPDSAEGREARDTITRVQDIIQRDITSLRSMMIDIYPPDLAETGLESAVEELADRTADHGLVVSVESSIGHEELPPTMIALIYRIVREGLHNVVKHARAQQARVRIERTGDQMSVSVADDGVGPQGRATVDDGHLGLHLLAEAVADADGTLSLAAASGGPGSVLEVSLPVRR